MAGCAATTALARCSCAGLSSLRCQRSPISCRNGTITRSMATAAPWWRRAAPAAGVQAPAHPGASWLPATGAGAPGHRPRRDRSPGCRFSSARSARNWSAESRASLADVPTGAGDLVQQGEADRGLRRSRAAGRHRSAQGSLPGSASPRRGARPPRARLRRITSRIGCLGRRSA